MATDKIIVISTHILEEVDAVCNRAIIISQGRIVADETPAALIHRSRFHNAVSLKLDLTAGLDPITKELQELDGVEHVETDDKTRTITAFPAADTSLLKAISDLAAQKAWPLEQLTLESGRLDEVFRTITTKTEATNTGVASDRMTGGGAA
jgi:ABC-2 type transport system ATP-binding protein